MNLWKVFGVFFLILAFIGALLPIMPTVPFVLAAAWCFARSSPKMHRWMRQHRKFGATIRNWEEKRCISRKMKIYSISAITLGGGTSTFLFVPPGPSFWAVLGVFFLADLIVLLIKECPPKEAEER